MLMLAYTARTVLNGIIMVHSTSQHVSIIAKGNYVKLATIVVIGMSSSTIAAKFSFTNINLVLFYIDINNFIGPKFQRKRCRHNGI